MQFLAEGNALIARRGGETLKMQNIVRRLFADKAWLSKIFGWLEPADKVRFFERFQASIAWDPSTHHATVVRMVQIAPELEGHRVKVERRRNTPASPLRAASPCGRRNTSS